MRRSPRSPRAVAIAVARPAVPLALEVAGWLLALTLAAAIALR